MYWKKDLPGKKSVLIRLSNGVNTSVNGFEISTTEATESLNTSNRSYPALATRNGMVSDYNTSATPITATGANKIARYGFTLINGQPANGFEMHTVQGTTWKKWSEISNSWVNQAVGLTSGALATFVTFNTATKKYIIMCNGVEKLSDWGMGAGQAITDVNMPASRLIATNDTRLFVLKDNYVSISDAGDFENFTTGDSDKIVLTGMRGTGTAIINYNDMIICFSDMTMHIIQGQNSDEFTPSDPIQTGCISDKAVLSNGKNGVLYFMSYGKLMAFTGGLPQDVSQKVKGYLENINLSYISKVAMGQNGKYLYISFPYLTSTVNNMTLEYDTEYNTWYPMNVGFDYFFNEGTTISGLTPTGIIYNLDSGTADDTTAITWSHTMGIMDYAPLKNLKHITDMYVTLDLPIGSTLDLSYSSTVDGNDFESLFTFTASTNEQNTRIRIPTTEFQRLKWYRLKFSGTGPCKVYHLEIYGRTGA
jgi:hypothetical protein